jgi:hypothetical protein
MNNVPELQSIWDDANQGVRNVVGGLGEGGALGESE